MKINTLTLSILTITILTSTTALAQVTTSTNVNLETTTSVLPKVNASGSATAKVRNERAVEAAKENEERKNDERSSMGDSHRSTVSTFVKSILEVSDREKGIGAQVKVIAQAQNDSEKDTTDTIVKIENRSSLKTFLVGTDYKNIGQLRSKMVKTANELAQLKKLAEKAVTAEDKAEISAEITAMELEQVKIETFISANENKFSLFGWLFKNKAE